MLKKLFCFIVFLLGLNTANAQERDTLIEKQEKQIKDKASNMQAEVVKELKEKK